MKDLTIKPTLILLFSIFFLGQLCQAQYLSFKELDEVNDYLIIENVKINNTRKIGTVVDIDGNKYKTIQIGTQTWMAENLRTTHFKNGQLILQVVDNSIWSENYVRNKDSYKAMMSWSIKTKDCAFYNWYTVNSEKLCMKDWHVPSTAEFKTLIDNLGGSEAAKNLLIDGVFNARLLGSKDANGKEVFIGETCIFWAVDETDLYHAKDIYISSYGANINNSGNEKGGGKTVRCIKD